MIIESSMTLHEALESMWRGTARPGPSPEFLILREAVRKLTAEQVSEVEARLATITKCLEVKP